MMRWSMRTEAHWLAIKKTISGSTVLRLSQTSSLWRSKIVRQLRLIRSSKVSRAIAWQKVYSISISWCTSQTTLTRMVIAGETMWSWFPPRKASLPKTASMRVIRWTQPSLHSTWPIFPMNSAKSSTWIHPGKNLSSAFSNESIRMKNWSYFKVHSN